MRLGTEQVIPIRLNSAAENEKKAEKKCRGGESWQVHNAPPLIFFTVLLMLCDRTVAAADVCLYKLPNLHLTI